MAMSQPDPGVAVAGPARHRGLPRPWDTVVRVLSVVAVLVTINQIFNLHFFVGFVPLENQYLALLAGLLLPVVFLIFPARRGDFDRLPWYDIALFAVTVAVCGFILWSGPRSVSEGWEYYAPQHAVIAAFALWLLLLEAVRRAGGKVLAGLVLLFSLYPSVADQVPGPISGFAQPIEDVAAFYTFSTEAAFGIPMRAFGTLVIGFVLFGVSLQHTGAGRFFLDLAFALLGSVRGGAAKVSIFSSGLLGSMSGSVITNVITTGSMTIPTMQRTGFSARYAAAVEACASTGGVLMPPVMGATAFVMASFLQLPYIEVAIAAAIPSILYYLGLFLQIDAYAAREGLSGVPRAQLPRFWPTFKRGWHYIFSFVVLVWMLLMLKQEALAPFYATAVLLVINQIFGQRLDWSAVRHLFAETGKVLAELVAILAAVGLVIGALVVTGLAGTVATDLVHLAGGAPLLLLAMGAVTSFILGMGMTVTAAYIFLAVVLAPALVQAGMDPLGVHLFILYWGMLSYITPPVSLGAFAAATIAGSDPMRAGLSAMKLGSIIYVIPFFFVLNPALILNGTILQVIAVCATALLGVGLISAATQGYLLGWGRLFEGPRGWIGRGLLVLGGLLFAFPGTPELGLTHAHTLAAAAVCALLGLGADFLLRRAMRTA